eukprot:COSAG06_NODE_14128_length_1186_cov_35.981601_1_plen_395_part_11
MRNLLLAQVFAVMWSRRCTMRRVHAIALRWRHHTLAVTFRCWLLLVSMTAERSYLSAGHVAAIEDAKASTRAALTLAQGLGDILSAQSTECEQLKQQIDLLRSHLAAGRSSFEKRIIVSTAQKMRQRGVSKSINAWRDFVVQRMYARETMRKVVQKMRMRCLAMSMSSWRMLVARKVVTRQKMRQAITRIENHSCAVAFDTWVHMLGARKTDLVKVKRVIARFQHTTVAAALVAWQQRTHRKIELKTRLAKVIQQLQAGTSAYAFLTWHRVVRQTAHIRMICFKAVSRMQHMLAVQSFNSMLSFALKMKRIRAMILHWCHRLTASVFIQWAELVVENQRLRELDMIRGDLDRAQTTVAQSDAIMHARILASTAQKMRMHNVTKSMNAWRAFVARK